MKITILSTSSSGNCLILENNSSTIMIDAGISLKKIKNIYNKELKLDALFITHEHSDHILSAGIVGRSLKCPVYLPEPCYNEMESKKPEFFKNCEINFISGGDIKLIKDLEIKAFSTKHDSVASVGYIIKDLQTNKKFAYLTDTGVITPLIHQQLIGSDAYFFECDYDTETLNNYPEYDDILKERIKSPIGHLSNQVVLNYINKNINLEEVKFILLGHLSRNTNSREILQSQINMEINKNFTSKIIIVTDPLSLEVK